jgi:hypothetical protein
MARSAWRNIMDWLLQPLTWLYGKFFTNQTPLSYLLACAIGMLLAAGIWTMAIDNYREKHPQVAAPQTGASQSAIVIKLLEEYRANHNGESPTFAWINQQLEAQDRDFRIYPPPPAPSAGLTITGGHFEGNGIAILNTDPNTQITIDGTNFINNKQGVANNPDRQGKK